MNKDSHIGVFDSGLGGLTVLKALRQELPNESFVYLADSGNAPYGRLKQEEIIQLASHNTEFLIEKNVKMVVVACNTATGSAIKYLRENYRLPFVGMEPAVKPAAKLSKSGVIGVLATAMTFEADHFNSSVQKYTEGVELLVQIGDGLVEMIEEGKLNSPDLYILLKSYLDPMIEEGVDQLVLGCTHYPLLIPIIKRILPDEVIIHDPAPAVARQTKRILIQNKGLSDQRMPEGDIFYSTGNRSVLDAMLKIL